MNACVLYSGGKDSTYSALVASRDDHLSCLITLFPVKEDSYMFHFPNIKWTTLQAEAIGIKQITAVTSGSKEIELFDLVHVLKLAKHEYGVECVYTGAIRSNYQKERIEKVCSSLNLVCKSPLWMIDQEKYLLGLLKEKFRVMVTSVSCLGLDGSWLGRVLDEEAVSELIQLSRKFKFNAALEGGEGETFVLDCPLFKKKIQVINSSTSWNGYTGFVNIEEARLVEKNQGGGLVPSVTLT